MKASFSLLLVAVVSGHRHHPHHTHLHDLVQSQAFGIDKDDLMSGAHWRKSYPEGIVDDSTDDDTILSKWTKKRRTEKDAVKRVTYPFELDDDIKDSQRHMGEAETSVGQTFGENDKNAYLDRGTNIINAGGPVKTKNPIYL